MLLAHAQFSHVLVFSLLSVFSNKNFIMFVYLTVVFLEIREFGSCRASRFVKKNFEILQVTMADTHTHINDRMNCEHK